MSIGGGLTSFGLGVYVLSVPAGVLADRCDRRLLMMLGDGLSVIGVLYILVCMMNGGADLYHICAGVFVSSVFSSLLESAYRASMTDLLSNDEYSRASGMVSLAGSARYLVSPLLAGLLFALSGIKLLLIIDICTFFLTVITTDVVRHGLNAKPAESRESFMVSLKLGWRAVT